MTRYGDEAAQLRGPILRSGETSDPTRALQVRDSRRKTVLESGTVCVGRRAVFVRVPHQTVKGTLRASTTAATAGPTYHRADGLVLLAQKK